jgi:hypothetical protein
VTASTGTLARPAGQVAEHHEGDSVVGGRYARWLKPGWPLSVLVLGYPLWWVLGVEELLTFAIAVPMALSLLQLRRIVTPRGFLLWVLFLVWVVGGVLVLQVDAPGAIPGDSNARYLTWAYRLTWYLACTVVLLYIGNNRDKISATRICRLLGWMFIFVTAGGLLGTFLPNLSFPSLLEVLLPNRVANQSFIFNLIHPTIAEIQQVLGHPSPRPSAPFAFANTWGLNFAVLLPFFLRGWLGRDGGWRRLAAPFILMAAAIPMIYSLNRGLWLALIAMAVFTAIRAALIGRPTMLISMVLGAVVVVAAVSVTPLGVVVQQRLAGENSNEGRANLSSLAVEGVAGKSPIAGFGTTRNVQGNFNTIAGGATALCPRCDPPALGTQGQLWLVIYSQGFVGLALFIGFFGLLFLRHIRSRSPSANMALAVLVASFVTMPVYNSLGIALFQIMIAVGLLWREGPTARSTAVALVLPRTPHPSLAAPRQAAVIIGCALLGVAGGAVWQARAGTPVQATTAVLLPRETELVSTGQGPVTIDTLARLSSATTVAEATRPVARADSSWTGLNVRAIPNTTILNLVVTTSDAKTAGEAVTKATGAYKAQLKQLFADRRSAVIRKLRIEGRSFNDVLTATDARISQLEGRRSTPDRLTELATLKAKHKRLVQTLADTQQQLSALRASPAPEAQVIRPAQVVVQRDYWSVALASGLLLGLLVGIVLVRRRTPAQLVPAGAG